MTFLFARKRDKQKSDGDGDGEGTTGECSSTKNKPQKELSDISIGDVLNNGGTKKRSFRKMINPQKYVIKYKWRRATKHY